MSQLYSGLARLPSGEGLEYSSNLIGSCATPNCACVFLRACSLNWRDIHLCAGTAADGSSLKKSVQKENSSCSRAKGERCLAAASSKQIGVGRASDLQWNDGRALSGRSVVIEADWSRQSERSSVERGERAILQNIGTKDEAADRGKL